MAYPADTFTNAAWQNAEQFQFQAYLAIIYHFLWDNFSITSSQMSIFLSNEPFNIFITKRYEPLFDQVKTGKIYVVFELK